MVLHPRCWTQQLCLSVAWTASSFPLTEEILALACLLGMLYFNELLSCIRPDGILNFLKNNKPMDALCVLGLTLLDLYPCETWSFTFSKFLPGQGGMGVP